MEALVELGRIFGVDADPSEIKDILSYVENHKKQMPESEQEHEPELETYEPQTETIIEHGETQNGLTCHGHHVPVSNAWTEAIKDSTLNLIPGYNFEKFVVDKSNRCAHAACMAVVEMPGKAYDPLYIHGGPGLGKTHLLQATAQREIELNPSLNVIYLSAERFSNSFIQAIASGQLSQFKKELCSVDMLLVDDVQLLNGIEQDQEEIFHIFNTIHGKNKQIVISSDRPPSELINISERLKDFFGWGIVADIQPPDEALYVAGDKVVESKASLVQTEIFAIKDIVAKVKEELGLTGEELLSNKRARHIAIYLCREMTHASFLEITRAFDLKGFTAIISAHRKIAEQLETDAGLQHIVENIKAKLSQ